MRHSTAAAIAAIIMTGCSATEPAESGLRFLSLPAGGRIAYEIVGRGADTVIVPGAAFLAASLRPLSARHTMIFYDPLGRGRSDAAPDSTHITLERAVQDLDALREHLGIGRASFLGFSVLSALVANYAARFPEKTNRIVMLGPVGVTVSDSQPTAPADFSQRTDSVARKRLATMDSSGEAQSQPGEYCRMFWRATLGMFVGDPALVPSFPLDFCELPNESPESFTNWLRWFEGSMGQYDFQSVARTIRAPLLVIIGDHDYLSSLHRARRWALEVPDARLIVLPGVGHLSYFEDAREVRESIDSFMRGEWPAGARVPAAAGMTRE